MVYTDLYLCFVLSNLQHYFIFVYFLSQITDEDLAAIKINLVEYVETSARIIKAYEDAVSEAGGKLAYACVGK